MHIDVVTIFPELFNNFLETSIIKRAQVKKKVVFAVHDVREYADERKVDDCPYGGGPGMVMKAEPFVRVVETLKKEYNQNKIHVVLLSPQGTVFTQHTAKTFASTYTHLILLCGRYEGIDERVMRVVDEEVSIGDYVLSGGELPAMVLVETIVRLIPGVIGKEESFLNDSFYTRSLDYPHYTRPTVFRGMRVPSVLLSGNHAAIETWRREQSLIRTFQKRPDLLTSEEINRAQTIIHTMKRKKYCKEKKQ